MTVLEKIIQLLDQNNIQYKLTEHEPVRTSEEAARIRGVHVSTGAKAMIIKSKAGYHLLVLPADQRIDWRKVESVIGQKKLRFATEEEAENLTGVQMGGVPPFGNILDLETVFDEKIQDIETVNFNAGSRSHSMSINSSDLIQIVQPKIASITL